MTDTIIQTAGFDYAGLDPETRITVRQKTDELKGLLRAAAQNIYDIGAKLTDVREQLRHNREGGFEGWLDAEFGMSPRTAYRFINVYEQFANSANLAELDIAASALYLLAAPSTPEAAREEALRQAEQGQRITHQAAKHIIQETEPEPTESEIEIVRELVAKALPSWTKPIEAGWIAREVRKQPGGAGVSVKAVRAALERMIQAGNVQKTKNERGYTVYTLAHAPVTQQASDGDDEPDEHELANAFAVKLPAMLRNGPLTYTQICEQLCPDQSDKARMGALRRALDTLFGEQQLKKDGGRYLLAESEPATVLDELNAKFDRRAITILGRTDDGAEHRAVDVARKLVVAGVWNGTDPIEFDAYELHDKLYGVAQLNPLDLVAGQDLRFFPGRQRLADRLKPRILELVKKDLTASQIRERLGIDLSDRSGANALRDALKELVADRQLRQVRDLYLPALNADDDEERDARPVGELIVEALADGPLTIQEVEVATRIDMYRLRAVLPGMIDKGKIAVDEDNRYTLPETGMKTEPDDDPDPFDDYARYQQYEMPAADVADFLARYYKADRYTGRGDDYAAALLQSYEERFEADGFVIISHHDSRSGEIVSYYGRPPLGMDVLLDQPVSRGGPDDWERGLPPTQTSKDGERILALLGKHAPLPLRMKHIRDQLDLPEERFTRARMLLEAGRLILVDGESLKLAPQPEPQPTVAEGSAIPYSNGNGNIHFSSDSEEWYTPADIVERVIQVLTGIDLDPCSNSQEAPNVPAALHFSKAEDGLTREWNGKVWMNPPYGRSIGQWIGKLVSEYEAGRVTEAIALVPARTDTAWFAALRDFPRCFVQGRITFLKPDGSKADPAPFPSALVYLGPDIDQFAKVFADLGDIYVRYQTPKEEGGDVSV